MSDNRNGGWRGKYGWGEDKGARGAFGESRHDNERFDDADFSRQNAVGYNPAGQTQGGYGPAYDRYRDDQGQRGGDNRDQQGRSGRYGDDFGSEYASRGRSEGRRDTGPGRPAQYGSGPYSPYGDRDGGEARGDGPTRAYDFHDGGWRDYGRAPREDRSFGGGRGGGAFSGGHNEIVEAVTDGRRSTGEHHGRGPKDYRRSDDRIREDINDRLTDDGWLDATHIDVSVSEREVTLSGTVNDRAAKRRAEDIAERVSGVSDVQNNLRVKPSGSGEVNDQTGASSV